MSSPNPFALKQSKLLNQSNALINLETSFLDLKSKTELNKTCRAVSLVISPQLRQLKAAKLLDHVLNIDEKRKKEILAMLQSPDLGPLSFMLTPANGQVKYRSSKQGNQIVHRATYNNMSPLEAAASCGDFHLVKLFEQALPKKQKHKAGLQLQAVLTNPNFLSTFKKLQSAYQTYLSRFDELYAINDWNAIDTLWEQVGEAQKNLSNFGLNVFCNPIPHHPLRDFTQEPQRAMRIEVWEGNRWKTADLDLDSIGLGSKLGLYKACALLAWPPAGSRKWAVVGSGRPGAASRAVVARRTGLVSEAIDLLCKVLTTELGNITERLLSCPETMPEQDVPAGVTAAASSRPGAGLDSKNRCVVS